MVRTLVVAMVALLATTPLAVASTAADNPEPANLVKVRSVALGAILTWAPTVGATQYDVYRALAPGEYELLDSTRLTAFVDIDAPRVGYVDYLVIVSGAPSPPAGYTAREGECVGASSSGVSVTMSRCVPESVWIDV